MGNAAVTGGLAGVGADLGTAHGTVTISMADAQRAVQTARAAANQIEQAFGGIDRGTKRAETGIKTVTASLGQLGGVFGVVFGVQAAQQLGRFILQSDSLATAYRRQSVAALNLAGSQAELNKLLATYNEATGGAISRAQSLSDVTRLQAVGFADTTLELQQFITAARGISIATGQSQDYVISQLQLAIANQSTLRLDQLGLGIDEVQNKVRELQNANQGLSDSQAYQNAVLGIAERKFGALARSVEGQATGAEKAAKAWADLSLEVGDAFGPAVGGVLNGLAGQLEGIRGILRGVAQDAGAAGSAIRGMGSGGGNWLTDILNADPLGDWARTHGFVFQNGQLQFTNIPGIDSPGLSSGGSIGGGGRRSGGGSGIDTEMAQRRRDEQLDFIEQTQQIERDANEQRLDATRTYEQQRTDTISDYGRQIAREAEDFARQRARAEAQFARQVADLREGIAKRETDWLEDLTDQLADLQADSAERIADAQESANERIAELNEDYQRDRERAERDHRDRLLSAAARLDASAVFEEQRRFARERQNADEAHRDQIGDTQSALAERLEQEQENLAERIQQEQEAHAERLADAREADAERLADMTAAFEEQKRLEDEDRALRLERMAEDHAAQLAQMATANAEQMAEIDRHEAEELASAQDAHLKALASLGVYNQTWKLIQDTQQAQALQSWAQFWRDFQATMPRVAGPATQAEAGRNQWDQVNIGNPATWNFSSAAPSQAAPRGVQSITVAPGAIQIISANGNPQDIREAVRSEFMKLLDELTN